MLRISASTHSLLTKSDLAPLAPTLIAHLLALLEPTRPQHEHAIKALMRVALALGDSLPALLPQLLAPLAALLAAVAKNPAKPHFTHYLFETFGVLIRAACACANTTAQAGESQLSLPLFFAPLFLFLSRQYLLPRRDKH